MKSIQTILSELKHKVKFSRQHNYHQPRLTQDNDPISVSCMDVERLLEWVKKHTGVKYGKHQH